MQKISEEKAWPYIGMCLTTVSFTWAEAHQFSQALESISSRKIESHGYSITACIDKNLRHRVVSMTTYPTKPKHTAVQLEQF